MPHELVFPAVMSVKPICPLSYNQGLRKPSGALPAWIRASLTREMMDADKGVDALVPLIVPRVPFQKKAKYRPCALMSG